MIEVRHLTKRYGNHTAVSDLSFQIEKGKIYGFLGPNGAGKSTTMNMIAGCLGATDGDVLIDGHSITEDQKAAKKLIGYLPEQPPLYMDMTPSEYLRFVLAAKGVPRKQWNEELERIMEKTKITEMKDRLIRNLSKGYRQRVGIAQALLGDPEIIILDEPSVGLDPAQIIEIRDLIKELGQDHTIILSSHILSEVQAVCDSIMIISKGHMVASDTAENLTALLTGTSTLCLEAVADEAKVREVLNQIEQINELSVTQASEDTIRAEIKTEGDVDIRADVFHAFAAADVTLLEMTTVRASLEDVFLELTQQKDEELEQAEADNLQEDEEQMEEDIQEAEEEAEEEVDEE